MAPDDESGAIFPFTQPNKAYRQAAGSQLFAIASPGESQSQPIEPLWLVAVNVNVAARIFWFAAVWAYAMVMTPLLAPTVTEETYLPSMSVGSDRPASVLPAGHSPWSW